MDTPVDRANQISRLVERRERNPRTHTFAELADLLREAGELDRALRVIEDGLRHHPHFLNARLVYARLLGELGRPDEAERAFRSVLEIDSENETARSALGESEQGAEGTISGHAPGGSRSAPRSAQWLAGLEVAWRGESRAPAESGRGGDDLETATLAKLYLSQGLVEEAVGIYERLLARDPYNARLAAALEDVRARGKGQPSTRAAAKPPRSEPPPIPRPEPDPPRPEQTRILEPAAADPEETDPTAREFLQALLEGCAPVEQGRDDPIDWPEWLRNLGGRP